MVNGHRISELFVLTRTNVRVMATHSKSSFFQGTKLILAIDGFKHQLVLYKCKIRDTNPRKQNPYVIDK